MSAQNNIEITTFPNKLLQKYAEIIIKQIESFEKKSFPKNEAMDIRKEISKKTNTLLIAYYEQDIQRERYPKKGTNKTRKSDFFNYEKNFFATKEIIVVGYIIFSNISSTQM